MNIALSLALGASQHSMPGGGGPDPAVPARVVTNTDYTLSVEAEPATGDITLVVLVEGAELGTFVLTEAEYNAPVHNLIPPDITGTGNQGDTLSVTPGLWLIDPSLNATPSYQWLRDGAEIAGSTGQSYVVQAADAGTTMSCRETLGPGSVASSGIAVDAPPGTHSLTHAEYTYTGSSTTTVPFTIDLSGYTAGDQLVFVFGSEATATAMTVAGSPAILHTTHNVQTHRRATIFTHTIGAAEAAAGIAVAVTATSACNASALVAIHTSGLSFVGQAADHDGNGGAHTPSLTPSQTTNRIAAVSLGRAGNFSGLPLTAPPSYSGSALTQQATAQITSESGYAIAVAAPDQPVASFAPTILGSGLSGDDILTVLLLWE